MLRDPYNYSHRHSRILTQLGAEVIECDITRESDLRQRRLLRRFDGRAFEKNNLITVEERLVAAVKASRPDWVWIEKGLAVTRRTLGRIRELRPAAKVISLQDDNPFGRRRFERSFWVEFLDAASLYHVHFVKRQSDFEQFRAIGAENIFLFRGGYDPAEHYPIRQNCDRFEWDWNFIGTNIDTRVRIIRRFLDGENSGIVAGQRWNRCLEYWCHRSKFRPFISDIDFREIVGRTIASLGLVSESNLDGFSGRSFQIPACGGLLLAMRTKEHEELFDEGIEAEYFKGLDEALDKLRFLKTNLNVRNRIAMAGYVRCLRSGYSLVEALSSAVEKVSVLE